MLTFVAPCRPFRGVFDGLQRRAVRSWRHAVPDSHIALLGEDIPLDLDIDAIHPTDGRHTLKQVWAVACQVSEGWVCVTESDIVFDHTLPALLPIVEGIKRPFVVGQRYDRDEDGTLALHPPSAVSYCLFKAGTVQDKRIPPFVIGRTLHDNWLVWAALKHWQMTVIDATACLTVTHINHPYVEYGDKQGMFRSAERAENERLAHENGMHRPYGINDAPWLLDGSGRLQQRVGSVAA